jgi:hypothetical protein
MKVKLLTDIPVEDKHAMIKGKIYNVIKQEKGRGRPVWVMGDAGEKIKIFSYEYEIVLDDTQ